MHITLHFHKYKYFPYEKRLALRETEALLGAKTRVENDVVHVDVATERVQLLHRLTYFAKAITDTGEPIILDQARWEASANGWHDSRTDLCLRRQSTRYSLHSLHEYKGRFNPQVVRAIGNLLQLEQDAFALDPFCGSGTVLLEAAHIGWNAVGLDLNPLAVMIANAKVDLCHLGLEKFRQYSKPALDKVKVLVELVGNCEDPFDAKLQSHLAKASASHQLPGHDYLERWFPPDVLIQFQVLLHLIEQVPDTITKSALKVCLSNIVREVSFQEPADLRIRRRKEPRENYPALLLFWQEANNLLESLKNAVFLRHLVPPGTHQVALHRDSRSEHALIDATKSLSPENRSFDAVITSPPYANALPYIDTQRLSLVLLGLAKAKEIMAVDRTLIGSREITNGMRQSLELALESNEAGLPPSVHDFLMDLLNKVRQADVGFRRQNRPALLYKYFADMKKVFLAVQSCLLPGAPFALVVGTNRTRLDGTEIIIPTPQFLADIALSVGFVKECIEDLDTYQRYDIHRANAINSESLVILRAR